MGYFIGDVWISDDGGEPLGGDMPPFLKLTIVTLALIALVCIGLSL